jgi:outer membrane biosynthesis protein TonB
MSILFDSALRGIRYMSGTLKIYGACFFLLLACNGSALAQETTEQDRDEQRALAMLHRHEIPEATLSCTPEEAQWWNELRAAGAAVRAARGGKKERAKFMGLLQQGQERSYQPPIPNRGATILRQAGPLFRDEMRKNRKSGAVALVIELQADGTVGEVKIVQGLGPGPDQKLSEALRQMIFLPAVKDRKFVTSRMPMEFSFNNYR